MAEDRSYTTEEIAALLKVSKLTVYDLIKKGELPSYRVGKQMRVDESDLHAYKNRAKNSMQRSAGIGTNVSEPSGSRAVADDTGTAGSLGSVPTARGARADRDLVITGQDVSLDILAKYIEGQLPGVRPLRSYVGSLDSLIAMYRGETDLVSTHLLDGDTGEYNLPYIRRLLVGQSYVVVNLLGRQAGFYVPAGNPKGLRGWDDLKRPELRVANRERGSGARVLLDEQLRLAGIAGSSLAGYEEESTSHMAVAGKVAAGEADFGVGIEKPAAMFSGVSFIPLIQERYDLVMLRREGRQDWVDGVIDIVRSERFQRELRPMGYDLTHTGTIWLDT